MNALRRSSQTKRLQYVLLQFTVQENILVQLKIIWLIFQHYWNTILQALHSTSLEKTDAALFIDVLQSADLQQHVHWPTHTSGHTLDLVISDSDSTVVADVRPGSFVSDHESVLFELTHPKPQTQYTVVQSRKINNIDKAKFQEDILSLSLYKSPSSDLTTLTDQYNTVVAATLDDHAPITKKRVAIKPNYP